VTPIRSSTTTTFLFTDIEGSTRLVRELPEEYPTLLEQHGRLVTGAAQAQGGHAFGSEGDAIFMAFADAGAAVRAAVDAQRALAAGAWPHGADVRVRMGIHTGDAVATGGDFVGYALHQAARITAAGHGGQILVSAATARLARSSLAADIELRKLGRHRLKDLAEPEELFQVVAEGLPVRFPTLRTLDARPNNLPVQLTSFIGRAELEAGRALLERTRLLTLTGPGGTGKTRLALQLAAEMSETFPDGVYFVALDNVEDPQLVTSSIVSAFGLRPPASTALLDAVVDHVRDRRLLLVLDNFEQIVDAAPTVARLLGDAPDLKIIVTSRAPLQIYGEQELPVPPLRLAEGRELTAEAVARSEAARLFVERAMAADPSFQLTDENAPVVAEIAARLDGLPLAIELAAARSRVLSVQAIRTRLDNALQLLAGGPRDRPARQQTLRGAIDWSHDLLDEADRLLFARFGVFAGGATIEQAEPICHGRDDRLVDVFDGLASLVEKSLLRRVPSDEPRYAMLATIREYALEKLTARREELETRRRHAETYVSLAEQLAPGLLGSSAAPLLDRLELEHDNMRTALEWAVSHGDVGIALRLVAALWRFWQVRGHLSEAWERTRRVLAMEGIGQQPDRVQAAAFAAAGGVAYWRGDLDAANIHYRAALDAARRLDDPAALAEAVYNFGFAARQGLRTQEEQSIVGQPLFEESLRLYGGLGDTGGVAKANWALTISAAMAGDFDRALRHLDESLGAYRRLDDPFGLAWALHLLAYFRLHAERDPHGADAPTRESLDIFLRSGDESGILLSLINFGMAAESLGDRERYWRLAGAVEALRRKTGVDLVNVPSTTLPWALPSEPADDETARRAWAEGERMSLEEAVAYATGPDQRGR
jgi:predicted ATPase/class 3 adenylate cyclase